MRLRNLILDLVTIKKVRYNNLYIKKENEFIWIFNMVISIEV